jgi:hypothetical protein
MFSAEVIWCPQLGHADPGWTMDRPRGTRQMTTLRKDPIRAPRTPINTYRAGVRASRSSGVTMGLSASRADQGTDLVDRWRTVRDRRPLSRNSRCAVAGQVGAGAGGDRARGQAGNQRLHQRWLHFTDRMLSTAPGRHSPRRALPAPGPGHRQAQGPGRDSTLHVEWNQNQQVGRSVVDVAPDK